MTIDWQLVMNDVLVAVISQLPFMLLAIIVADKKGFSKEKVVIYSAIFSPTAVTIYLLLAKKRK